MKYTVFRALEQVFYNDIQRCLSAKYIIIYTQTNHHHSILIMKEARYFYVPQADLENELPTDEAIHAIRVLRLKQGDEMFLIDGKGKIHQAEVTLISNKCCKYRILSSQAHSKTWNSSIHLAIAPTKDMGRMEWLAEKATEIGFDEITFIQSKFSERKVVKTDRIDRIIISAMKQSRKAWKPQVNELQDIKQFIAQHTTGERYICHCYNEIERTDLFQTLTAKLQQLSSDHSPSAPPPSITILIGPEGDFSIDEVRLALEHQYQSISLGESRLRTETAGLFAISIAHLASRRS